MCDRHQFVPAHAYAWNARIIYEREARLQKQLAEKERERLELEEERRRFDEERRFQREAAAREEERQNQLAAAELAELAVAVGIIAIPSQFSSLDHDEVEYIEFLSLCADLLRDDLLEALGENAAVDKAVAYGRPAAAGASVASLLAGYGWAGMAFAALAVSARWLADDWRRAKLSEYQAKWGRLLSDFDAQQMETFTRVFAHKYPGLAATTAHLQHQIGS